MERVTVIKDYGDNQVLIAISGRCDWTNDAQIRMAIRKVSSYGTRYEPTTMDDATAEQLKALGFNVCKY